ncbi:MAG: hypothetical protein GXY43_08500 [Clostridiaceae bacterium]|nr:hypothetical protein [Clostridiaceae bacterium]
MMKRIIVLVIAMLIVLSALTSCSVKTPESKQSSEITTVAEPSTATPTEKPTEAPTEEPTEATTTNPVDEVIVQMNPYESLYLRQEEKAWISGFYPDGVLKQEDINETTLPAGTMMIAHSIYRPDSLDPYPGNDVYVLTDGRYVFFDHSTSANGEVLYNGRTLPEFFGSVVWGDLSLASWYDFYDGEKKIVENYELLPNTPLDPSIQPQNMVIIVDWNGDGKTDSIVRECPDPNQIWDCTVWYTDGATGTKTDVTDRFFKREWEEFSVFSDYIMLFKDENTGRYALIDTVDTGSADYSVIVYSFDSNDIITYTETWGSFVFENGKMFLQNGGYLFGNVCQVIEPLIFDGTSVSVDESNREVWWVAAYKAKKKGDSLPGTFTYTLTDVSIEKKSGDGYEELIVPGGIAIFPQYYEWNEDEEQKAGYAYFLLVDGSECRSAFRVEDNEGNYYWSINGTDQRELFFCLWGG